MNRSGLPLYLRLIAACLLTACAAQDAAWAAPEGLVLSAASNPRPVRIAPALGRVESTHAGRGPLIVHIRDAHANPGAQKNTAEIIRLLKKEYGVDTVFLEGGTRDDSLGFLAGRAPLETRRRVANKYVLSGELSGPEFLSVTAEPDMKLLGVEDKALYDRNLRRYADVRKSRERVLGNLSKIGQRVGSLKRRLYPQQALAFDEAMRAFRAGEAAFSDTFDKIEEAVQSAELNPLAYPNLLGLAALRKSEQRVDFVAAQKELAVRLSENSDGLKPELSRLEKLKRGSPAELRLFESLLEGAPAAETSALAAYTAYLRAFSRIDLEKTLEEIESFEDEYFRQTLGSSELRRLHAAGRHLERLADLFAMRISRPDFERLQADSKDIRFRTVTILSFLNRLLVDAGRFEDVLAYTPDMDRARETAETFYRENDLRDEAMVGNLAARLNGGKTAVLVAGGWHTENLKRLLAEKDFSYAVVSPNVEVETNHERYEKTLMEGLDAATSSIPKRPLLEIPASFGRFERELGTIRASAGGRLAQDSPQSRASEARRGARLAGKKIWNDPARIKSLLVGIYTVGVPVWGVILAAHYWMRFVQDKILSPDSPMSHLVFEFYRVVPRFVNYHWTNLFGDFMIFSSVSRIAPLLIGGSYQRWAARYPAKALWITGAVLLAGSGVLEIGPAGFDWADFGSAAAGIFLQGLISHRLIYLKNHPPSGARLSKQTENKGLFDASFNQLLTYLMELDGDIRRNKTGESQALVSLVNWQRHPGAQDRALYGHANNPFYLIIENLDDNRLYSEHAKSISFLLYQLLSPNKPLSLLAVLVRRFKVLLQHEGESDAAQRQALLNLLNEMYLLAEEEGDHKAMGAIRTALEQTNKAAIDAGYPNARPMRSRTNLGFIEGLAEHGIELYGSEGAEAVKNVDVRVYNREDGRYLTTANNTRYRVFEADRLVVIDSFVTGFDEKSDEQTAVLRSLFNRYPGYEFIVPGIVASTNFQRNWSKLENYSPLTQDQNGEAFDALRAERLRDLESRSETELADLWRWAEAYASVPGARLAQEPDRLMEVLTTSRLREEILKIIHAVLKNDRNFIRKTDGKSLSDLGLSLTAQDVRKYLRLLSDDAGVRDRLRVLRFSARKDEPPFMALNREMAEFGTAVSWTTRLFGDKGHADRRDRYNRAARMLNQFAAVHRTLVFARMQRLQKQTLFFDSLGFLLDADPSNPSGSLSVFAPTVLFDKRSGTWQLAEKDSKQQILSLSLALASYREPVDEKAIDREDEAAWRKFGPVVVSIARAAADWSGKMGSVSWMREWGPHSDSLFTLFQEQSAVLDGIVGRWIDAPASWQSTALDLLALAALYRRDALEPLIKRPEISRETLKKAQTAVEGRKREYQDSKDSTDLRSGYDLLGDMLFSALQDKKNPVPRGARLADSDIRFEIDKDYKLQSMSVRLPYWNTPLHPLAYSKKLRRPVTFSLQGSSGIWVPLVDRFGQVVIPEFSDFRVSESGELESAVPHPSRARFVFRLDPAPADGQKTLLDMHLEQEGFRHVRIGFFSGEKVIPVGLPVVLPAKGTLEPSRLRGMIRAAAGLSRLMALYRGTLSRRDDTYVLLTENDAVDPTKGVARSLVIPKNSFVRFEQLQFSRKAWTNLPDAIAFFGRSRHDGLAVAEFGVHSGETVLKFAEGIHIFRTAFPIKAVHKNAMVKPLILYLDELFKENSEDFEVRSTRPNRTEYVPPQATGRQRAAVSEAARHFDKPGLETVLVKMQRIVNGVGERISGENGPDLPRHIVFVLGTTAGSPQNPGSSVRTVFLKRDDGEYRLRSVQASGRRVQLAEHSAASGGLSRAVAVRDVPAQDDLRAILSDSADVLRKLGYFSRLSGARLARGGAKEHLRELAGRFGHEAQAEMGRFPVYPATAEFVPDVDGLSESFARWIKNFLGQNIPGLQEMADLGDSQDAVFVATVREYFIGPLSTVRLYAEIWRKGNAAKKAEAVSKIQTSLSEMRRSLGVLQNLPAGELVYRKISKIEFLNLYKMSSESKKQSAGARLSKQDPNTDRAIELLGLVIIDMDLETERDRRAYPLIQQAVQKIEETIYWDAREILEEAIGFMWNGHNSKLIPTLRYAEKLLPGGYDNFSKIGRAVSLLDDAVKKIDQVAPYSRTVQGLVWAIGYLRANEISIALDLMRGVEQTLLQYGEKEQEIAYIIYRAREIAAGARLAERRTPPSKKSTRAALLAVSIASLALIGVFFYGLFHLNLLQMAAGFLGLITSEYLSIHVIGRDEIESMKRLISLERSGRLENYKFGFLAEVMPRYVVFQAPGYFDPPKRELAKNFVYFESAVPRSVEYKNPEVLFSHLAPLKASAAFWIEKYGYLPLDWLSRRAARSLIDWAKDFPERANEAQEMFDSIFGPGAFLKSRDHKKAYVVDFSIQLPLQRPVVAVYLQNEAGEWAVLEKDDLGLFPASLADYLTSHRGPASVRMELNAEENLAISFEEDTYLLKRISGFKYTVYKNNTELVKGTPQWKETLILLSALSSIYKASGFQKGPPAVFRWTFSNLSPITEKMLREADSETKSGARLADAAPFAVPADLHGGAVLVLPGQLKQFERVKRLYEAQPAVREIFARAGELLGYDMAGQILSQSSDLEKPLFNQPASFVASYALYSLLEQESGGRPLFAAAAGNSLGEIAALTAAGSLTFEDALKLVQVRARHYQKIHDETPAITVLVRGIRRAELESLAQAHGAAISAVFSEIMFNVAGPAAGMGELRKEFIQRGAFSIVVGYAGHIPLLEPARKAVEDYLRIVLISRPRIPILANTTGEFLVSSADIRKELADSIVRPVEWSKTVRTAEAANMGPLVELGYALRPFLSGFFDSQTKRHYASGEVLSAAEFLKNTSAARLAEDVRIDDSRDWMTSGASIPRAAGQSIAFHSKTDGIGVFFVKSFDPETGVLEAVVAWKEKNHSLTLRPLQGVWIGNDIRVFYSKIDREKIKARFFVTVSPSIQVQRSELLSQEKPGARLAGAGPRDRFHRLSAAYVRSDERLRPFGAMLRETLRHFGSLVALRTKSVVELGPGHAPSIFEFFQKHGIAVEEVGRPIQSPFGAPYRNVEDFNEYLSGLAESSVDLLLAGNSFYFDPYSTAGLSGSALSLQAPADWSRQERIRFRYAPAARALAPDGVFITTHYAAERVKHVPTPAELETVGLELVRRYRSGDRIVSVMIKKAAARLAEFDVEALMEHIPYRPESYEQIKQAISGPEAADFFAAEGTKMLSGIERVSAPIHTRVRMNEPRNPEEAYRSAGRKVKNRFQDVYRTARDYYSGRSLWTHVGEWTGGEESDWPVVSMLFDGRVLDSHVSEELQDDIYRFVRGHDKLKNIFSLHARSYLFDALLSFYRVDAVYGHADRRSLLIKNTGALSAPTLVTRPSSAARLAEEPKSDDVSAWEAFLETPVFRSPRPSFGRSGESQLIFLEEFTESSFAINGAHAEKIGQAVKGLRHVGRGAEALAVLRRMRDIRPGYTGLDHLIHQLENGARLAEERMPNVSSDVYPAIARALNPKAPVLVPIALGARPAPVMALTMTPGIGGDVEITGRILSGRRLMDSPDLFTQAPVVYTGKYSKQRASVSVDAAPKSSAQPFPGNWFARLADVEQHDMAALYVDMNELLKTNGRLKSPKELQEILQILNLSLAYRGRTSDNLKLVLYGNVSAEQQAAIEKMLGSVSKTLLFVNTAGMAWGAGGLPEVLSANLKAQGLRITKTLGLVYSDVWANRLGTPLEIAYVQTKPTEETSAYSILVALAVGKDGKVDQLPAELRSKIASVGREAGRLVVSLVPAPLVDFSLFLADLSRRTTQVSA